MTELTPEAQAVVDAYEQTTDKYAALASVLRETINQLQQSPGVIMCADVLELCEELEAL
jgi:hypothetical protein